MYVTRIEVSDMFGIQQFEWQSGAEASPLIICGGNGVGKTSVLRAIRFAFGGQVPAGALRNGADIGHVSVRFGRFQLERVVTLAGAAAPVLRDATTEEKVKAPTKILKAISSRQTFDPLAFMDAAPAARIDMLARSVDVPVRWPGFVDVITAAMSRHSFSEDRALSAGDVITAAAEEGRGTIAGEFAIMEVVDILRKALRESETKLRAEALAASTRADALQLAHNELESIAVLPPAALDSIEGMIAEARDAAKESAALADPISDALVALGEVPSVLAGRANLGSLSLIGNSVFRAADMVPLDALSSAEQLEVALEVARRLIGESDALRCIFIDGIERLARDRLVACSQWAQAARIQIIATRVLEGPLHVSTSAQNGDVIQPTEQAA